MPKWINSDHLTLIGFLGMVLAGVCYFLAKFNRVALVAAVVCLGVNWFGDSLDGTLARVRDRQRPRYGFYVDHILDSFGALFLMGGLGLSGYMTITIALALIITYFLLSIELYLATYCVGVFRLSFSVWGPTELRIVLAIGTFVLFQKPVVTIAGTTYFLCDVAAVVAMSGMLLMTIMNTIRNTARLYREERLP
ncbi:MAG TPA: CDP-alcohol phosphatidyltransferase family protein [Pyrinomonadaceae bacterium]|nr:CDP-alcohol phosphatidyltransferase family protein [Pyrinomonadaceae bacterium]